MSDGSAPPHRPSTGFLRRSQARTGLSKALRQFGKYTFIYYELNKKEKNDDQEKIN